MVARLDVSRVVGGKGPSFWSKDPSDQPAHIATVSAVALGLLKRCRAPPPLAQPWGRPLPERGFARITRRMNGFIYFNISDHARLPARFFGMTRNILSRLR